MTDAGLCAVFTAAGRSLRTVLLFPTAAARWELLTEALLFAVAAHCHALEDLDVPHRCAALTAAGIAAVERACPMMVHSVEQWKAQLEGVSA